jgi:hypothetical protein
MVRLVLLAFTLAVAVPSAVQRNDVFTQVNTSGDIAWLEKLASEMGAAEAITPSFYTPKTVRAAAYVRLGELGSDASLDAARRVEAAAREWSLVPKTVSLKSMPHPSGHFGDPRPEPFALLPASDGFTNGLIALTRLGGFDIFLMVSRTPDDPASWSKPLLLPDRAPYGIAEPRLKWNDAHSRLILEFLASQNLGAGSKVAVRPYTPKANPPAELQTWTIDPVAVWADRDGDGWTDIEETRLRTSASAADSDRDGIPDGRDVAPRYAPSALEQNDPEVKILQKVFFAAYGIHGSADLLCVGGGSRPFQPWGSRAPILFDLDRADWIDRFGYGPPKLNWKVTRLETDATGVETATVTFGDFEAALAAANYVATVKRYKGDWFVTKIVMTGIS